MRALSPQPTLVDQVYQAILSEISEGKFGLDSRLIQEEIAESLGVSRQPVQQALLLLRSHGLLRDAPGRGLMVAPLDPEFVRNLYEVRAVLDGLASSKAAERNHETAKREGPAFIARGREAVKSRSIAQMIATDMDFHFFLYGLSTNPLVAEVSGPHWSYLRRVMGEVLMHDVSHDIWDEHERILEAVIAGDVAESERLARYHISHASGLLIGSIASHAKVEPINAPFARERRARS